MVKPKNSTIKNSGDKVGRNDPCPCGSGKKYKHCNCSKIDRHKDRALKLEGMLQCLYLIVQGKRHIINGMDGKAMAVRKADIDRLPTDWAVKMKVSPCTIPDENGDMQEAFLISVDSDGDESIIIQPDRSIFVPTG